MVPPAKRAMALSKMVDVMVTPCALSEPVAEAISRMSA